MRFSRRPSIHPNRSLAGKMESGAEKTSSGVGKEGEAVDSRFRLLRGGGGKEKRSFGCRETVGSLPSASLLACSDRPACR